MFDLFHLRNKHTDMSSCCKYKSRKRRKNEDELTKYCFLENLGKI